MENTVAANVVAANVVAAIVEMVNPILSPEDLVFYKLQRHWCSHHRHYRFPPQERRNRNPRQNDNDINTAASIARME